MGIKGLFALASIALSLFSCSSTSDDQSTEDLHENNSAHGDLPTEAIDFTLPDNSIEDEK